MAAIAAAEGEDDDDKVGDRPRLGMEARGDSKGDGGVRGGSCGGEYDMVIVSYIFYCLGSPATQEQLWSPWHSCFLGRVKWKWVAR